MPTLTEYIRGAQLRTKPAKINRCGLSKAKFANHCKTNQWFELSTCGKIIGQPTEFDFYKLVDDLKGVSGAQATEKTTLTAGR